MIRPVGTAVDAGELAPAGFWIRFVAVLIDLLVFLVTDVLLGAAARLFWGGRIVEAALFKGTLVAVLLLFAIAYYVVLHTVFGQTIGKAAVGVKVVGVDDGGLTARASILRCVGYVGSFVTFLIGFAIAGFRRDRRALHDLLAGTRVVRVPVAAPAWLPDSTRS
jgi:uncharacterized RDD family membrane protein YckC